MKTKLLFLVASSVLLSACSLTSQPQSPSPTPTDSMNQPNSAVNNQSDSMMNDQNMADQMTKTYTLDEIAQHNSASDCWMAIHGKVYDVTSFVPSHPGEEAILLGCGKDATSMFESRPGSGTAHSQQAHNLLENFLIGDLAQ